MPLKKKDALILANTFCPDDFSWHEALYSLYALQHYESMGKQYGCVVFYTQIFSVLSGLENTSRKTLLHHLQSPACIVCDTPIDIAGKKLDHIVPLSQGGPDTMENTMVLCRQHNSSKGSKDLLEWWLWREWEACDLPRNILCLYARIMWQHLDGLFDHPYDLPEEIREFVTARAGGLPSAEHRLALYGSTYAAMAFRHWEHQHDHTSTTLL